MEKQTKTIKANLSYDINMTLESNGMISCYIPQLDLYFSVSRETEVEERANSMILSWMNYIRFKKQP